MKKLAILIVLFACSACEEELDPPEITGAIRALWVGARSVEDDSRSFDLQLNNMGEEVLIIESIKMRGDQNCAFEIKGPDTTELGENDAAFIRGWYHPESIAVDQIVIEITSNADNMPLFIVPICGQGIAPEDDPKSYEPMTCNIPPPDQPDCTEI
ncbi:MAG: hypothetical protein GY854_12795 [Deltaproteobacteria bacterium]|nr:hypothetical protein [Deltaproteobacteria bacterium]